MRRTFDAAGPHRKVHSKVKALTAEGRLHPYLRHLERDYQRLWSASYGQRLREFLPRAKVRGRGEFLPGEPVQGKKERDALGPIPRVVGEAGQGGGARWRVQ